MANGPFKFDRVKETSTTTGTGALTLAGAASGFRAFSDVLSDTDLVHYVITHQSATEWECGVGTFASSGTTLTRTRVKASSNSGSAVSFGSGTKDVFIGPSATQLGWVPEITPPPTSGWTWDNQGAGTLTLWGASCRSVYTPAAASVENLRAQYRTGPTGATPYKAEMGLLALPMPVAATFSAYFVGWRSSGGAYRGAAWRNDSAGWLRGASFSSATGSLTQLGSQVDLYQPRAPFVLVRLEDDGTNRAITFSPDGVSWLPAWFSEGRTNGITPNAVCFGVWTYDRAAVASLVHYREY